MIAVGGVEVVVGVDGERVGPTDIFATGTVHSARGPRTRGATRRVQQVVGARLPVQHMRPVKGVKEQRRVVARIAADATLGPRCTRRAFGVAKPVAVLLNDEHVVVGLHFGLRVIPGRVGVGMHVFVPGAAFVGDVVETAVGVVTIGHVNGIVRVDVDRGVAPNEGGGGVQGLFGPTRTRVVGQHQAATDVGGLVVHNASKVVGINGDVHAPSVHVAGGVGDRPIRAVVVTVVEVFPGHVVGHVEVVRTVDDHFHLSDVGAAARVRDDDRSGPTASVIDGVLEFVGVVIPVHDVDVTVGRHRNRLVPVTPLNVIHRGGGPGVGQAVVVDVVGRHLKETGACDRDVLSARGPSRGRCEGRTEVA